MKIRIFISRLIANDDGIFEHV